MSGSSLSIAIITLNEEDRLPACLNSLGFAQEIVVVDSGSQDQTVRIAKEHFARVFHREWSGFGPQKQFAIDLCRNDWVLILDADEQVPAATAAEILRTIAQTQGPVAYSLARKNYVCGQWVRHGGWWPDRTIRLFRKERATMSERLVHEALEVTGSVGHLENPLIHYPFRNLSEMMIKMDRYSTAGAKEMAKAGREGSFPKAFVRAGWAFFFNYLIRCGFLDRGPGLLLALSDAVNVFFKYGKLAEITKQSQRACR